MNFFRRLLVKTSRAYSLHGLGPGKAQWNARTYTAFSREAYQLNVIAYSAINRISSAISSIEWEAWENGRQLEGHPILDLLRQPNPTQSGPDWWRMRISYLLLSGNLYDEMVLDSGGVPSEFWTLRPDRMTILKGSTGVAAGYEYRVNQEVTSWSADEVTGVSPILHTKLFHPMNDWYGMSPIEAAAYSVDQHNEATNWIQSLLQNSARPSGTFTIDKDRALSDDEFRRMKREVEEKYSGSENAGRPMLLEGGAEWKSMGLSPMDMEMLRTKEAAARDISLAFGVPPLLLNIPGDNTYANYREARLGFYEDTILPFVSYIIAPFVRWLSPYYPNVELRPNKDKIEAIADKRTKLWKMADESLDLTLNEARALKGYDPLPTPLGDMLMAEVRQLGKAKDARGTGDVPAEDVLKELAFGLS